MSGLIDSHEAMKPHTIRHAKAFFALEPKVNDLLHMATMVSDRIDDLLGEEGRPLGNGNLQITMSKDEAEVVSFAARHLRHMIEQLRAQYLADFRG